MENPPLLSFAQKCARDLMKIKALIKLACYPLSSWRGHLDCSLKETFLHRGCKSLTSHMVNQKKTHTTSRSIKVFLWETQVSIPWPEDPDIIFIFCTDQTSLISGPSVKIVLLGSYHKNLNIEEPGMWQSIGSQRVGHNWATEQQHKNCIMLTAILWLLLTNRSFFLYLHTYNFWANYSPWK